MSSFGEALTRLWPNGDAKIPGLLAGMIASAPAVFRKYGIVTPLQIAHVMAQLSHECGAGHEVEENLNYSPRRMPQVWPSRFPSYASALPYAGNPQKLANKVYNGRMGNRLGSNDGYDFRGRGGSQTTGREGYEKLARKTGLDLVNNPDLVNDPRYFLECAVADFVLCGCLPYCAPKPGLPDGDIRGVTHHLNGGYIGLAQRQVWFAKWKAALHSVPVDAPAPVSASADAEPAQVEVDAIEPDEAPADDGVLRYGRGHDSPDFEVKAIQGQLVGLGYQVGASDGDFGGGTRAAVLAFQADNGLQTTGEVDATTKAALKSAPPKPISEKRANTTVSEIRSDGSVTVAKADSVSWYGKALAWTGLVGGGAHGAQKVGLLDTVKDTTDQVSAFRGVFDQVHDAAGWVLSTAQTYWWIVLLGIGFFGIKFGGDIIKQRLADHRSATNMGH